jgi:hypothetical protein
MRFPTCAALLLGAGVLAGCGTVSNQLLGVPPTLQQSNLVADAQLQNQVVDALIAKAGFLPGTRLEVGSPQWKYVAQAGLLEVDLVCDRYLASLFAFNREQRAGRQVLTAAGAGTAAIMGLTGAPGISIALVAAAFGLAANVFDAGVNSVLFTVSPAAVRAIAAKGRQVYLSTIKWETVDSRPMMMSVVQVYLSQCTPASIEANIDNAATGAPSVVSSDPKTALAAAMAGAPSSSVAQAQAIATANSALPAPPPGPVSPPGIGLTADEHADGVTDTYVRQVQEALCVPVDGNVGGPPGSASATRTAMRQYLSGAHGGNPDPSNLMPPLKDEMTRNSNRTNFDKARDDAFGRNGVLLNCAQRSVFLSDAYEVGRWGNTLKAGLPDTARSDFQLYLGKMQKALGLPIAAPSDDAALAKATRDAIALFREKNGVKPDMPTSSRGFDYTLAMRLAGLPE